MRGLLAKLKPIVRESVEENVSIAMQHAKEEFEPWLQQSDEKRDMLFGHLDNLRTKLEALKSDESVVELCQSAHAGYRAALPSMQQSTALATASTDVASSSAEPTFAVERIFPTMVPMILDLVKQAARQHVMYSMEGVNAEVQEWLARRDAQRMEMQRTVSELAKEFDAIKAAVQLRLVDPKVEELCTLAGDAAAAASTDMQEDSLALAQRDAQSMQRASGAGYGTPQDFMRGLLSKLRPIVRESVEQHVSLAMGHATQEFEPWLQRSDEKRAALTENLETLKRKLSDLKTSQGMSRLEIVPMHSELAPVHSSAGREPAFPVASILPVVVQIVREVAREHVVTVMGGVNTEFREWLDRRDIHREEMSSRVNQLSKEFELMKACYASQQTAALHTVASSSGAAASSTDVSADSLSIVFAKKEEQAVDIASRQMMGGLPMDDFTRGLLEKLGGIVRESVHQHVNVAMVNVQQEFEPMLQRSDAKRDELARNLEELRSNLDSLRTASHKNHMRHIDIVKERALLQISNQFDLMKERAMLQVSQQFELMKASLGQPGSPQIQDIGFSIPALPATSSNDVIERQEQQILALPAAPSIEPPSDIMQKNQVALPAASSADVPVDTSSAIAIRKEPQEMSAPSRSAMGAPPANDFTRGLLESLGGIVRETVKEHVEVAMVNVTQEFEPLLQQSADRRKAMFENVDTLKKDLDAIKES